MLTSEQVAALIAQQQQAFGPSRGISAYPPQFSWSPNPQALGTGTAIGMAGGMIGAAPRVAESAVGIAGMVDMGMSLGNLAGLTRATPFPIRGISMLDPFGAGMEAGMGAWGMTAGMGTAGRAAIAGTAGLGVGAAVYGGWEMAKHGAHATIAGMQQNQALTGMLRNSQMLNPMSRTGRGFDASGINQIGNMMRALDASDPFTSMRDLNSTMGKFTEMGMAQGVRDATEFASKFKAMARSVREMARTMGTTMDEAGAVFQNMRSAGFYSSSEVMGNTRQMRAAGALGVGAQAFQGMQAAGASMARGMGFAGSAGATAVTNMQSNLGMEIQSGRMSETQLMDITGGGTPEEAQVLMSQRLTGGMTNFLQTSAGRAMLAATGVQDASGRFTGEVDTSRLRGQSLSTLSRRAQANMGTSKASKASFVTHERELMGNFLKSEDAMDLVIQQVQEMTQEREGGTGAEEDIVAIVAKQLGMGEERDIEIIQKLVRTSKERKAERVRNARRSALADQQRADMAENRSLGGLWRKATGTAEDYFAAPFEAAGGAFASRVSGGMQDAEDWMFGVSRYNLSDSALRGTQQDRLLGLGAAVDTQAGSLSAGSRSGLYGAAGWAAQAELRSVTGLKYARDTAGVARDRAALARDLEGDFTARSLGVSEGSAFAQGVAGVVGWAYSTGQDSALEAAGSQFGAGNWGQAGATLTKGGAAAAMRGVARLSADISEDVLGKGALRDFSGVLASAHGGRYAARQLLGDVTGTSGGFVTQEAAKKALVDSLTAGGLSEAQASEMAKGAGGSGSSLLTGLARAAKKSKTTPQALLDAAMAEAENAGEGSEGVARILSEKHGVHATAADVEAVKGIKGGWAQWAGSAASATSGWGNLHLAPLSTAAGFLASFGATSIDEAAGLASSLEGAAAQEEGLASATATIKEMSPELQKKLGLSGVSDVAGLRSAQAGLGGKLKGLSDSDISALGGVSPILADLAAAKKKGRTGIQLAKDVFGQEGADQLLAMSKESGVSIDSLVEKQAAMSLEAGGTGGAVTMQVTLTNLNDSIAKLNTNLESQGKVWEGLSAWVPGMTK